MVHVASFRGMEILYVRARMLLKIKNIFLKKIKLFTNGKWEISNPYRVMEHY